MGVQGHCGAARRGADWRQRAGAAAHVHRRGPARYPVPSARRPLPPGI